MSDPNAIATAANKRLDEEAHKSDSTIRAIAIIATFGSCGSKLDNQYVTINLEDGSESYIRTQDLRTIVSRWLDEVKLIMATYGTLDVIRGVALVVGTDSLDSMLLSLFEPQR